MKRISFRNGNIEVAGNVHLPPGFDCSLSYPAIVLATPGSSVKEQIRYMRKSWRREVL